MRSLATAKASQTRPPACWRCLTIRPAQTIRPPVFKRSIATLPALEEYGRWFERARPQYYRRQQHGRRLSCTLLQHHRHWRNSASGFQALFANTTGELNTAIGTAALQHNVNGIANTAVGYQALLNSTGSINTAIGENALQFNTTGVQNVALGWAAGNAITTANNVICIGSQVSGANISNSCFIGNIRGVPTGIGDAVSVVIDSNGQLGKLSSSRRFKKDIKPMDEASEAVLALKPVTFHYKRPQGCYTAIWSHCRGSGRSESRPRGARQEP